MGKIIYLINFNLSVETKFIYIILKNSFYLVAAQNDFFVQNNRSSPLNRYICKGLLSRFGELYNKFRLKRN
jgi:hypothetical protein